jgi:capsule biosynthesis phosphatase
LNFEDEDQIFLGLRTHIEDEFQIENLIRKEIPKKTIKTVKIDFDTRGAAETIYIILQTMTKEEKMRKTISLDCDTIYFDDILTKFRNTPDGEGVCFFFHDEGDKPVFSYIKLDSQSKITEILEKSKISNNANTGAYGFSSALTLEQYCSDILDKGVGFSGEYYISNLISRMIASGKPFSGIFVKSFSCVGTPWQLQEFLHYLKRNKHLVKPRRFCFDLDNTLVTAPTKPGDYSTVLPKTKNIRIVQDLKESGHFIIISTARRMKTHNGNVGAIIADVGMVTLQSLKNFEIPCDEIYFGKPYADVYVDDLAVNALIDTEKELGWVLEPEKQLHKMNQEVSKFSLITPRSCNTIQVVGDVVIKSSTSPKFAGEVYFYKNMPEDIKHLFPKYLNEKECDSRTLGVNSIRLDRIRGITCSHLLTSRCLTTGRFVHILDCLYEIHQSQGLTDSEPVDESLIYENYGTKLKERYEQFTDVYIQLATKSRLDYLFNSIYDYLETYRAKSRGIKVNVIHGDPVFSNILLTNDGACKFIDMRGSLGKTLTMSGDLMYDLAKIYQSVWGYDFVLIDRYPLLRHDIEMLAQLREIFRDFIQQKYNIKRFRDIEIICASLLFSLIPLHDENLTHRQIFLKMCESIAFPFGVE